MSSKIAAQLCAICEREKKPKAGNSETSLDIGAPRSDKGNTVQRHKYGYLPAKKNDDFIQVIEPQWLRRGNLKESDYVCKRHLAILMRGVDRGCEGGCCSPLHRGARLCKPGSLKAIPPTWRRRFVKHPKIKEEDKDLMMFCWECYKKHMNRMSKYGDPMGRVVGSKQGIQRSYSMVDSDDSGASILQAMKRYKSMDKLDTEITLSAVARTLPRSASSGSFLPRQNGDLHRISKTPDSDVRSSPARRTNRGRRSHKGRRSPSPPNNISPVRTSVVHSKRKHSPHKSPKSPSAWRSEVAAANSTVTQSRNFHFSPRNTSRSSVDEGALADTESPRDPPVPPPGLFSLRMEASDEVFDVFDGRSPRVQPTPQETIPETNTALPKTPLCPDENDSSISASDNTVTEYEYSISTILPEASDTGLHNGIHNETTQNTAIEQCAVAEYETPGQAEESTTSADEMAAIFANHHLDEEEAFCDNMDGTKGVPWQAMGPQTSSFPIPSDLPDNLVVDHQHESSSGSSSDKTGDTQIERDGYKAPNEVYPQSSPSLHGQQTGDVVESQAAKEVDKFSEELQEQSEQRQGDLGGNRLQKVSEHKQKSAITTRDFTDSVFLSPTRQTEGDMPSASASRIKYSLSPQSFRRLESMRLQCDKESSPDRSIERHKIHFDDDVRERSHPLRNHVLLKVPGGHNGKVPHSYIRLPAEDIEIFPDTLSFLDGITQTVGEDMVMYAQDGVRIAKVDLQHAENRNAHHTSNFSDNILIVRRGQSFEVVLALSEKYEDENHRVMVELMLGDSPRVSNGSHIFVPVQRNGTSTPGNHVQYGGQWSAHCTDSDDMRMTISLKPPATCAIGCYKLYFQIEKDGTRSRWQCGSENDRKFIVLFNPWNIDDAVFMSSQADRQEYVVSDTGCIYSGNKTTLNRIPWVFGQYESGILQACINLIESASLSSARLGDPVTVTKAICRQLTKSSKNPSHNGWLRSPETHHGSGADILQRFFETGCCATSDDNKVLSALLVTVLRCLGLPSRPVTCINCALETDLSMYVNVHYSHEGHCLDYMNTDKVWPSYSWAGVWMSRVDLPPGFGGWQALLPSTSCRECVGPIPAYGIKKGQTSCCEGTQEHFVSLNAAKNFWLVSQDGNMNLFAAERSFAGVAIFTKSVGSLEPHDVTKLYKFNEGCEEHKLAVNAAYMHGGSQNIPDEPSGPKQVTMSLSTMPQVITLGNEIDVITKIKNNSDSVRHLTVNLDVAVLADDGSPITKLQRETILAEVLTNESVDIPVKVNLAPCLHKLTQNHHLSFTAFGSIRDMEPSHVIATHLAGIKYLDIEIQVHGEFKVNGEVTVLTRLRNPLPYVLGKARITLHTTGLTPLDITPFKSGTSVGPWQVYKSERLYRCQRAGKHTIVAAFSSDILNGPMGMQQIEIT